jgi:hypothetical protein
MTGGKGALIQGTINSKELLRSPVLQSTNVHPLSFGKMAVLEKHLGVMLSTSQLRKDTLRPDTIHSETSPCKW